MRKHSFLHVIVKNSVEILKNGCMRWSWQVVNHPKRKIELSSAQILTPKNKWSSRFSPFLSLTQQNADGKTKLFARDCEKLKTVFEKQLKALELDVCEPPQEKT